MNFKFFKFFPSKRHCVGEQEEFVRTAELNMVVEMDEGGVHVFIVVCIVVYFRVCRFYIAAAVCRSQRFSTQSIDSQSEFENLKLRI